MGEGYCLCDPGDCIELVCPWCRRLESDECCPKAIIVRDVKTGAVRAVIQRYQEWPPWAITPVDYLPASE